MFYTSGTVDRSCVAESTAPEQTLTSAFNTHGHLVTPLCKDLKANSVAHLDLQIIYCGNLGAQRRY